MRHVPSLAICSACGLAFFLAWLALQPYAAPVPTGPFLPGYSAARAQQHVQAFAQAPRPAGSIANGRARDYLLARIRAIGLEPDVQVGTVSSTSWDWMSHAQITLATARNIVVRKPGVTRGGAVLAMAHYDSRATTLGAADGGASAAALLEAMRVLQAGPPLDNDILFVFTDADAVQPMGARAFMQSHPWAKRVRVALRFDNAGNRGPLELFTAEHADGFAVDAWSRGAPAPQGSSFKAELDERLPQSAGAAPLAGGSFPVLHFATTQGSLGWDGVHDLPQRLSSASLQHEGDTMLALLRRFGNATLPSTSSPPRGQVYFSLPLIGMVHYDYVLIWPLALLACVLGALACRAALRNGGSVPTSWTPCSAACSWPCRRPSSPTCAAKRCRRCRPATRPRCSLRMAARAGSCWDSRCCRPPSTSPCNDACNSGSAWRRRRWACCSPATSHSSPSACAHRGPATCWPGRCWPGRRHGSRSRAYARGRTRTA
ncbi:M28 family peptidase [Massilia putida]|uniref:M28 family peptidase n=1 Tax=Massilia putida TaxID=1141883 RepID=UPI0009F81DD6|nr:M28 family peptidase [Massilia putida]